ncbi:MAG: D-aminoacyl-tRNA deacylase [Desulfobulbaceae bacterium]|nr:D-aminoacyl-tRNA deacylase [Desulfobulbaceae bacterium]
MRAVIQLVREASVTVDNQIIGSIGKGLLVLLGVHQNDTAKDVTYLAGKIANLRIFNDNQGKMNLSVQETGGEILVVSQFTLLGDCRKGRRPSYSTAAPPAMADRLYQAFINELLHMDIKVATGKFQAMMEVRLLNDGPITLVLDSPS